MKIRQTFKLGIIFTLIGMLTSSTIGYVLLNPAHAVLNTSDTVVSIALIRPTFTSTAYSSDQAQDSFYDFYALHGSQGPGEGVFITTDLEMLNSTILNNYLENSGDTSIAPYEDIIQSFLPNAEIEFVTDIDVHNGLIFNGDNSNKYDIMLLTHAEYLTQEEYDNLQTFTFQGGVLIFLDGNVMYAEVDYDANSNSIQLVSGHNYQFNGTHAFEGPREHWAENNTAWFGSNYYCNQCETYDYDPFEYLTSNPYEDNYVTNPNVLVIVNYHATTDPTKLVATYELEHGEGKSIVLGLHSTRVRDNTDYQEFLSYLIINRALDEPAINPQEGCPL